MRLPHNFLLLTSLVVLAPLVGVAAQEGNGNSRPNVFFDCDGRNCNDQYYRTEIDWVNWVRDREVADVHVIMTSLTTGAGGRETHIRWLIGSAPPPPNMRIDDHARDGVMIYWDNFSEVVPDNKSQRFDFEGYQLWRADDWTRPLGTSVATGPPTELWSALFQADIFNFFGEDVGLERFFYEPLVKSFSASELKSMLDKIRDDLLASPEEEPPCPFGHSSL